jgi:alkanesulfonate monooxygenase SsuD/methylene tetrahydromethanopterin reductase-like flavin-dependent oxidoreductase (luciferase family)
MNFGLLMPFQNPPRWARPYPELYREYLAQIVQAEELGYDTIWLTEHHFDQDGWSPSLLPLAAGIATRTQRIRIGTFILILPFHHALRVAEDAATVDILSNGRLDLGVGKGYRVGEFVGFGISREERDAQLEEGIEVLRRAWTEERFSYEGRFFKIPEARVIPKPVQRPHPPLYQVCVSKDTIEATALRGLSMLNSLLYGSVEQLVEKRDTYVKACQKAGRSNAAIQSLLDSWGVSRHIYVAPTDTQALEEAKEAELWYQEALRRFQIPDRIEDAHPSLQPGFRAIAERLSKITWDGLVAETLAFGSPETVAKKIEEMHRIGVGQVMCWMNFGGLPQDKVRRSMELFAREVMPRFR